jgi:hypothetical protein
MLPYKQEVGGSSPSPPTAELPAKRSIWEAAVGPADLTMFPGGVPWTRVGVPSAPSTGALSWRHAGHRGKTLKFASAPASKHPMRTFGEGRDSCGR